MTAVRQIARLTPGQDVTLKFTTRNGFYTEDNRFVGLTDGGERATFTTHAADEGTPYNWDAYRFQGRWVYGSSAQRLSLVVARPVADRDESEPCDAGTEGCSVTHGTTESECVGY